LSEQHGSTARGWHDNVIYELHSLSFHECGNLTLGFADKHEMSTIKVTLRSSRTTLQRFSWADLLF